MKVRLAKKFRTSSAMAAYAAGLLGRALRQNSAPVFTVALPGGRTPLGLFTALAAAPLNWNKVHFFMSDERLVPLASAGSNFGQARRLLFSKLKVPAGNLHPVRDASPAAAAAAYEKELKKTAGRAGVLDVVFLGLGEDGHTASLFPGAPVPAAGKLVVASLAPAGITPRRRVTFTPEAVGRAALVVLLAAGPAKKKMFAAAVRGDKSIPAGALRPHGNYYLLYAAR